MSISLNRFNAKTVTPTMDARINEHSMPTNGVFNGMVMTHLGSNQVQITAGNGIIKGRDFDITQETLLVQLAPSGTMNGRIYIRINLSDAVTPIQILSVCAATLPALTQDANFNESNGIWEEELATYSATTTLISGLTTTIKTIMNPVSEYIKNVNTVTEEGFMADARQLNPNIAGSFANTVNESFNWKTLASKTAIKNEVLTLPTTFKELKINCGRTTVGFSYSYHFCFNELKSSLYGYRLMSNASSALYLNVSTTQVKIPEWIENSADAFTLASPTIEIYYR